MDHFESIVATLLEAEHYWVKRSFKVILSKEEKRRLEKPSLPRVEIDLLGFNYRNNTVVVFEAKSYLDSRGVPLSELQEIHATPKGRYKLFTCSEYRSIVLARMKTQLIENGMADEQTKFSLGLAAGNIHLGHSDAVREFCLTQGWLFWSPEDIKQKVEKLVSRGYENDPIIITAKILLR